MFEYFLWTYFWFLVILFQWKLNWLPSISTGKETNGRQNVFLRNSAQHRAINNYRRKNCTKKKLKKVEYLSPKTGATHKNQRVCFLKDVWSNNQAQHSKFGSEKNENKTKWCIPSPRTNGGRRPKVEIKPFVFMMIISLKAPDNCTF